MFPNDENDKQEPRGADRAGADGQRGGSAVPFSNTGRKNESGFSPQCAESADGIYDGERIQLVARGAGYDGIVRHPLPDESANPKNALIDWLAFTLTPPAQIAVMQRADGLEDAGYRWTCSELVRVFKVEAASIERKNHGMHGYTFGAEFPGGKINWGGASQRGTINVSFSGEGCSRIEDWPTVAAWLESQQAKLKRVDLAHDDFTGETINIEQFRKWNDNGEFGAGGRKPDARLIDDLGSGKGCTFYVGNRPNGKFFRGYEKGKEKGDPTSLWVRAEVEFHDTSRVLPYDMLIRPGMYLAGAYPCLRFLNSEQCKIKTIFRGGKISFNRAMYHLRQQGGKLINFALSVFGGDYAQLVESLRRDGTPKRLEPYSYHMERIPGALESLGMAQNYAT